MNQPILNIIYDSFDTDFACAYNLLRKHSGNYIITTDAKEADAIVTLQKDAAIMPEAYHIKKQNDTHFVITASDSLGFIYGLGFLVHRGHKNIQDYMCKPKKHVRGIYFATHFHNFYQDAPIESVIDYLEELVFWGTNCVAMWFDMHHFSGMEDAEAMALLTRIRSIYQAAKKLGINTSMTMLANEYYYGAPEALLAENSTDGTGYTLNPAGFYGTELCPAKPEGERLLLEARRKVLAFFKEIHLDYVLLWPYDQGGCTCPDCRPWGANGFIRLSQKLAKEIHNVNPDTKCVLSLWRFDSFTNGEWAGLFEQLTDISADFDMLMVDFSSPTTPQNVHTIAEQYGLPLIEFPDISMMATPWGGFGAAPCTAYLEGVFDKTEAMHDGGFCYSEGIFEDLNKILMLSLYVGTGKKEQAIEDYFRFYFSDASVPFAQELIQYLETSLSRRRLQADGTVNNYPTEPVTDELPRFIIKNPENVEKAYALAEKLACILPDSIKETDRFKMLYLRTVIDAALAQNEGKLSQKTETASKILEAIYHAHVADYVVSPITEQAIRETRGHI